MVRLGWRSGRFGEREVPLEARGAIYAGEGFVGAGGREGATPWPAGARPDLTAQVA